MALESSWETPVTLAAGDPFSAALVANVIEGDLRFLHGAAFVQAMPFCGIYCRTSTNNAVTIWSGEFRHRTAGTQIAVSAKVTGTSVANDAGLELWIQKEGDSARCMTGTTAAIASVDGDATTISVTTATPHGLAATDSVVIDDTANYDGVYIVASTPTSTTFTITDAAHDLALESGAGRTFKHTLTNVVSLTTPVTYASVSGLSLADGDFCKVYVVSYKITANENWYYQVDYVAEQFSMDPATAGTWTAPPAVTDGDGSSIANHLTVWNQDLTWLYNRIAAPGYAMHSPDAKGNASEGSWTRVFHGSIQHVGATLVFLMSASTVGTPSGNPDMRIVMNNGTTDQTIYTWSSISAEAYSYKYDTVDLSSFAAWYAGLTLGNLYEFHVDIEASGSIANYRGRLEWLFASDLVVPAGATAWVNPADWTQGDYVLASTGANRLQYVSDDLTYLYNLLNTNNLCRYNFAVRDNTTQQTDSTYVAPVLEQSDGWEWLHKWKWLHWTDHGLKVSWSETNTSNAAAHTQSLDAPGTNIRAAYDLDYLNWLVVGCLLHADANGSDEGHWCFEDRAS